MRKLRVVSFAFLALICGRSMAVTSAVSLAAHTPGNAVAYLGWAGADALAADYGKSPLQTLVNESNLRAVADDVVPKLWERVSSEPQDRAVADAIRRSLLVMWRHPTAMFITEIVTDKAEPVAHSGLLCDAGVEADKLVSDLQKVAGAASGLNLNVDRIGSVVRVTNYVVSPGPMLDHAAGFTAAMRPLQADPATAVYVDGQTILKMADAAAAKDDGARAVWPRVRDALGLTSLTSYTMTAGFEAGNWVSASALIAPGPRTGLLAAIEPHPVDAALLARVPATAEAIAVYNFDAAKLFDTVAGAMAVTPQSDKVFHQGTGVATMLLGRNFRRAILGPLGPQWVVYTDSGTHRSTLLNHPSDADAASDSMVSAVFGLINTANAQVPNLNIQAVQKKLDGVDVTSADSAKLLPYAGTPTFAVSEGILYFGQSPESVVASAKLAASGDGANFMNDKDFATTLFRLHVPTPGSIDYCDIPKTAPRALASAQTGIASLQTVLQQTGVQLPNIELPSADKFAGRLSPSLSVTWADTDGVYTKSVSPFPFSGTLLGDPQEMIVSVGTTSLATSILVPSILKAREAANQVATASNQRQLLLAMIMWSMDHKGNFPPDPGTLIVDRKVTDPKLFLRRGSVTTVPPEIITGTPAQQAEWVNEHADFTYLAADKNFANGNAAVSAVLVEKNLDENRKVTVGFADGHVEQTTAEAAQKYLDAAK